MNVDHDVSTQKHDGVNDKEADSVVTEESDVTSTVVEQHDGQGNTNNLIVIDPSQPTKIQLILTASILIQLRNIMSMTSRQEWHMTYVILI